MRAVDLLAQILKVDSDSIQHEVLRSKIMAILMELCRIHVWNNAFHTKT